jgi:hypothetical protein
MDHWHFAGLLAFLQYAVLLPWPCSGATIPEAAEQSDEPDEALELKMSENGLAVINVRFAGYRCCSPTT